MKKYFTVKLLDITVYKYTLLDLAEVLMSGMNKPKQFHNQRISPWGGGAH